MIEFKEVRKVFPGGKVAVNDINFAIEEDEFFCLIGTSGCGKTTTLKMINLLEKPSSGEILINGTNITEQDPVMLRRDIGYVIQKVGLFPHFTVQDNIALIPRLKKWSEDKIKNRVVELLEMMDLEPEEYADKYPGQLSGGQQQRVGIARAMAANPEIILMDEPFGALDPITRESLQIDLKKLQKKLEKTIVFVTHDIVEALKMSDRLAIMKDGNIIQLDTPLNIITKPASDFVEQFVGTERFDVEGEAIRMEEVIK